MAASPLTRHFDKIGLFSPQYFGSVLYYAELAAYDKAIIDLDLRYDKRFKSTHRCDIADTHGKLSLTVPVTKPGDEPCRQWKQVRVSSHGHWWLNHLVSLESAYGRTPFFEFYIHRFMPWLQDIDIPVTEMDKGIDAEIRRILGITTEISYSATEALCGDKPVIDLRANRFSHTAPVQYYQVRADKLGFIPSLSILDLIFNLGPEAPLTLKQMQLIEDFAAAHGASLENTLRETID